MDFLKFNQHMNQSKPKIVVFEWSKNLYEGLWKLYDPKDTRIKYCSYHMSTSFSKEFSEAL